MDQLLTHDAYLSLQGMLPLNALSSVSLKQVHAMVGEAFSAPCVTAVIGAALLNPHADWWKPEVHGDLADTQ